MMGTDFEEKSRYAVAAFLHCFLYVLKKTFGGSLFMKKILLVVFVLAFAVGIAAAQSYTSGTGITGVDILGAHQNGGRGCAGCHAPHSGGAGGGGSAIAYNGTNTDPQSGSIALFGQDVTPLFGVQLSFGNDNPANNNGGYIEILPSQANAYKTQTDELKSVMMCLACHDGVIAKGQMMNGQSWEQRMSLLPTNVYGTRSIPTLLGNDSGNGNASGYTNDHPVGTQATLAAAGVWTNNTTSPLTITVDATNGITNIAPLSTAYQNFSKAYGYPALAGTAWEWGVAIPNGSTDASKVFVTCRTCHNQHAMYVYNAPIGKQGSSKIVGGTYPTYFFINGPYNPSTVTPNAQTANSTTQFCRQCHFDTANEAFGITGVTTQF